MSNSSLYSITIRKVYETNICFNCESENELYEVTICHSTHSTSYLLCKACAERLKMNIEQKNREILLNNSVESDNKKQTVFTRTGKICSASIKQKLSA